MKLSTLFLFVPVALLATLFAIANREDVVVHLNPFEPHDSTFTLAMPLYLLVFAALLTGVLLGGAASALGRSRARRNRLKSREIGDAIDGIETQPLDEPRHDAG